MLCLSRKKHEQVLIGNDIRIVVLRTTKGQVRLAIQAPEDVPIVRGECDPALVEAFDARDPFTTEEKPEAEAGEEKPGE